ncbi:MULTISPECIES: M23 family metallopeptidase [Microbacterium]|uniref:M23 family metallopeptidase n=1 Tax=Microbacterium TaxID=33882 RepID=UPI00146C0A48|nr:MULTISPECIES: M23 family metallopeptidase [Microbacterium]
MAEPARTRRSSRTSPAPLQASSETLGLSRAELRRRAVGAGSAHPLTDLPAAPIAPKAAEEAAPITPNVDEQPAPVEESSPIVDVVAAVSTVVAAAASVEAASTPSSRRARRTPRIVAPSAPVASAEIVPVEAETAVLAEQSTVAMSPVVDEPVAAEPVAAEPVAAEPVAAEPAPAEATVEAAPARPSRRIRTPRPAAPAEARQVPAVEVVETLIIDEPTVDTAAVPTVVAPAAQTREATDAEASGVDEFEAAARLFSFTGEFPVASDEDVQVFVAAAEAESESAEATPAHKASRKPRVSRGVAFKRVTAASFSVGVMGIVGLMTVGMTTPAEAVAAASGTEFTASILAPGDVSVAGIDAEEIQAYVAPASVEAETLDRGGNYDTTTVAELASQAGIRNFSSLFHNDPNAAIQWPFVVGVPMSYGYGMRDGRLHKGIDFTPGSGAPIQSIADGTVRIATEAGGDYGVHVIIDHVIDGQLVSSHYGHMQYGSLKVTPGQHVTVGTVLGLTGNTGRSYGAHLHFEILANGTTAIDPMPWLRTYAGG